MTHQHVNAINPSLPIIIVAIVESCLEIFEPRQRQKSTRPRVINIASAVIQSGGGAFLGIVNTTHLRACRSTFIGLELLYEQTYPDQ